MNRFAYFIIVIAAVLLSGCSEVEHVSVAEFKKEYAMVGQPQSMRAVAYLGTKDGRAFLRVSTMRLSERKWKERVIYIDLTELDGAFRRSLPEKPNQPLEPTTTSVTSPADAGAAPAVVVAHL